MIKEIEPKPFGSTRGSFNLLSQEDLSQARKQVNCIYLNHENYTCTTSTYKGKCKKQDKELCQAYQLEQIFEQRAKAIERAKLELQRAKESSLVTSTA